MNYPTNHIRYLAMFAALVAAGTSNSIAASPPKPLKALLIAGGCCHDYATQKDILKKGIEERAYVTVDIVYSPDTTTKARFDLYEKPDWAKGYDVIIHDECSADVKDMPYVEAVVAAHKSGVPAVNFHCAMHCYRTGTDDWFKFIGIQSTGHGPQKPIEVSFLEPRHAITTGLANWTTGDEELYNNIKLFPSATPLARGKQITQARDGTKRTNDYVVIWANDYGGTRVFNTTLGHNNLLVSDARYLDLVTRGLLWACGQLNDSYLKPQKKAEADAPSQTDEHANALPDTRLPTPVELSALPVVMPEKAAALLKEVKVPAGFDAAIFATAPAVNYPVFIAAAPDGTLYVSSDGNGSLDRAPGRGRILRVRDRDGSARADEVKVFVPDVDSPRGLVWDYDRLYLLHPPDISVYFDRDRDGVAEEHKVLVKNIAFTFKDRPADHSSNGLELGVDGWLYAAIGDFGFLEAEGTDGRKLQLHGGGVVRVRPDGTGLELFARGTRNILEVAVSPLVDGFARDNTNDGGGWDVRFHHFTGLEDHGYPRLFKYFAEEIIAPLADYGGGSGCGAAWIDEPGIPASWNNAPFTADWGRGWVYRHGLTSKGASFSADQKEFAGLTRPTDLDVDALSRITIASWKGATFKWAGNDAGYLVRLTPKNYTPEPLPDFDRASEAELVKLLESPSHRRRLEAQRTLLRRWEGVDGGVVKNKGNEPARAPLTPSLSPSDRERVAAGVAEGGSRESRVMVGRPAAQTVNSLIALASTATKPLASRIAALFALKQRLGAESHATLTLLASNPTIAAWAIRALTDHEGQLANVATAPLLEGLKSADPRVRKEAIVALVRLSGRQSEGENDTTNADSSSPRAAFASAIVPLLVDTDPVVAYTAMHALASLRATDVCFAAVDHPATSALREAALRVLRLIHEPRVVDGLFARLVAQTDSSQRRQLLTALCRLHFIEGPWKGDSWGTRPDARGPYYQPQPWSETPRIGAALKDALDHADAEEAAFLASAFARHRIPPGDAISRLLTLVDTHPSIVPAMAEMLASIESVPDAAVPILERIANDATSSEETRAHASLALIKVESAETLSAVVEALTRFNPNSPDQERVASALFSSRFNEAKLRTLIENARKLDSPASTWADAVLLKLAARRSNRRQGGSSAQPAASELETGWKDPRRRAQILEAMVLARDTSRAQQVLVALSDSDPAVVAAAERTAKTLKLGPAADSGAKVGDLKLDDVIAAVLGTAGEPARGQQLFTEIGCVNCHTVKADEPPKGPFLGNIATIYIRRELAESILMPNKSIAQGFAAWQFELKGGDEVEGFVVQEAADVVTIRNITAQELHIRQSDIARREKLEKSLMPEGLAAQLSVKEFGSLIDYLQKLAGPGQ